MDPLSPNDLLATLAGLLPEDLPPGCRARFATMLEYATGAGLAEAEARKAAFTTVVGEIILELLGQSKHGPRVAEEIRAFAASRIGTVFDARSSPPQCEWDPLPPVVAVCAMLAVRPEDLPPLSRRSLEWGIEGAMADGDTADEAERAVFTGIMDAIISVATDPATTAGHDFVTEARRFCHERAAEVRIENEPPATAPQPPPSPGPQF